MIEEFKRLTAGLRYRPKAVFPSEMFMFYSTAKAFKVDQIIESGIGNGGSTAYLAKLFPDLPIISIDKDVSGAAGLAVTTIKGNAVYMLPDIVARSNAQRIGALIDGPKGKLAIRLAKRLLNDPKVQFVAVHDLAFEGKQHLIDSHDPEFRKRYGFLDSSVGAARKKHPNGPGLSIFKC